ncbi:hypothetical protein [Microbulbifer sp. Q7]|uniref:hypothetical protein n=1 Tax=Microbulbifer sp. Q7 TaxID=1785091 RepID=UPI00128FF32C|nr:hypothetical protein [Microbulbifer sp. Q7]
MRIIILMCFALMGCVSGTTSGDRLSSIVSISVSVHYENGEPAKNLPVEIKRFFVGKSFWSMGSMVPVSKGITDESGVFTYMTQLNGTYDIWIGEPQSVIYRSEYRSVKNLSDDLRFDVVLKGKL